MPTLSPCPRVLTLLQLMGLASPPPLALPAEPPPQPRFARFAVGFSAPSTGIASGASPSISLRSFCRWLQRPLHWHKPAKPPRSPSLTLVHRALSGPPCQGTTSYIFPWAAASVNMRGCICQYARLHLSICGYRERNLMQRPQWASRRRLPRPRVRKNNYENGKFMCYHSWKNPLNWGRSKTKGRGRSS
jgi:hypothetical protein